MKGVSCWEIVLCVIKCNTKSTRDIQYQSVPMPTYSWRVGDLFLALTELLVGYRSRSIAMNGFTQIWIVDAGGKCWQGF